MVSISPRVQPSGSWNSPYLISRIYLTASNLQSSGSPYRFTSSMSLGLSWWTFGFSDRFSKIFFRFLDFLTNFKSFWIPGCFWYFFLWMFFCFCFFGITFKVAQVTIKVTKGTTGHQQLPKNRPKQHNKLFFCRKGKKNLGWSPPQEPEIGPQSGLYL